MDIHQIFINAAGRLRSGWRVLIFVLVYVGLLFLLSSSVRIVYAVAIHMWPGRSLGDYVENIIFRLILLAGALLAGYFCTRWLEGLPWRALGLTLYAGWFQDLLLGSLI